MDIHVYWKSYNLLNPDKIRRGKTMQYKTILGSAQTRWCPLVWETTVSTISKELTFCKMVEEVL